MRSAFSVVPSGLASAIGHSFGHGLAAERLSVGGTRREPDRDRRRFDRGSKAGWGDALLLHHQVDRACMSRRMP